MSMIPPTSKGYDFFSVSSAFQKSVRRGDEKTALYFAVELFNSGYGTYLWKRIKTIVSEDIGLAEPMLPATIYALEQNYLAAESEKKDSKPERLQMVHAVVLLCRAKKSRLNDWLVIALWREHQELKMEIPDYAIDQHTAKGKAMGRGFQHFAEEGTILNNHEHQHGELEAKADAFKWREKYPNKIRFEKSGKMHQKINFAPDEPEQKNLFE